MSHACQPMRIGSLARAAGVNVETVRYYQRMGLLRLPPRPQGESRVYRQADLERLRFIRNAKRLGFSLQEIAGLLSLEDGDQCEQTSALAEQKLADVRERMAALARMEKVLAGLVDACHRQQVRQDNAGCPILASLHKGNETE